MSGGGNPGRKHSMNTEDLGSIQKIGFGHRDTSNGAYSEEKKLMLGNTITGRYVQRKP